MSKHQFLPIDDKNTQRNFADLERIIGELPAQGVIGSRWKFVQSQDGSTCTLQYWNDKQWVVKATWP